MRRGVDSGGGGGGMGGCIPSSVASLLVLGGGGQAPQMYRQKKIVTYMRERAPQKHIYFRSQNTSAHTINAVPFYYL